MRAFLPAYEMVAPKTLAEALALLGDEKAGWRPFAGGTDVMVMLEAGKLTEKKFVSLWNLSELRGIDVADGAVTLGALTTYAEVREHDVLRREFPDLCGAARETGAIAIQSRGTLGGNIGNASPAADSPPSLLVHEADLELVSSAGARWVRYRDFHLGYKKTLLRPGEIISKIRLPRPSPDVVTWWRKVGTRRAQAISKVAIAGWARPSGRGFEVRVAFGSVAPTCVRCPNVEALVAGKPLTAGLIAEARAALAKDVSPIDDIRSTREYRLRVAQNLLGELLGSLAART